MLRRFSSTLRGKRKEGKSAVIGKDANGAINEGTEAHGTLGKVTTLSTQGSTALDHVPSRSEVESTFTAYANLLAVARQPTGNHSVFGRPEEQADHSEHSGLWEDIRSLGIKDAKTLIDVLRNTASGKDVDDKTMLMERVIQLVSALPSRSKMRSDLTIAFVDQLWSTLDHPPQTYLGNKYQYRSGDGSGNNVIFPDLGAANTPYARSVAPLTIQPAALPDPGVVFDCLFARNDYKPHPNNVSSVLFYWASIIIHDLFQTDHVDFNNSQTSSYLDLSPLYGDTQADQDTIRTFSNGKLKADCFAEDRLLAFPPGVGVILIMFNRFHNYVVEQLAIINEGGRFTKPSDKLPPEQRERAWKNYDNDLFQTGRLITCGLYINITLGDYLRTIVNLNRSNTTWTLDPRVPTSKGLDHIEWGVGNQCSAEFNLVYRWHSAISAKDEKWTEEIYSEMFGKPYAEVSMRDLLIGLKNWEAGMDKDPQKRPFAKLQRLENGQFADDDLVKIITEAIEDTAGSFGANNVPKVLRAVEILGMQQARHWRLGSLNEFRKFFKLEPHKSFESINSDPQVAEHLRRLYDHPDFVEMYPGLVAEEAKKPMVPGVGICPTYTISRAILSDAVTLVRGDRFYTVDYNARNLTNWGYNEVQYDFNVEQGCVISRLFYRAFPNHFLSNSIYAHYPMTIPSENKKIMTDLGRVQDYSWDRPKQIHSVTNLTSYHGAKYVLEHQDLFHVTCADNFEWIWGVGGRNFVLSGNTPSNAKQKQIMSKALYRDNWQQEIKDFYEYITLRLLHDNSYKLAGVNEVDVTRDVGNLAHIHFAANVFSLPLKSQDHPNGIYTEHEMCQLISLLFICIFLDVDLVKSFEIRQAAKKLGAQLSKIVEMNVRTVNSTGWIAGIVDRKLQNKHYLTDYGVHMVRQLLATGMTVEEATYSHIMPTAVTMVGNQAKAFTQALDFYLSEKGKQYLPDINRLARLDTPEADEKILHYAMEGIRLNGTFGVYRQATSDIKVDDGKRTVPIRANDRVFVSFASAGRDPVIFSNPDEVSLTRPLDSYIHYGSGVHTCLDAEVSKVAITAMLKTVCRLDNLRRAPGERGELKKILREGDFHVYLREDWGSYTPFPTTMRINWDGDLIPLPVPKNA